MPGPWDKYAQQSAPADGPWAKYASPAADPAPKPTPVVEGSLSANKQPEGWFQQAQEDLQGGGNRTILGRTLGHLQGRGDQGYTGLQSGTSKGAAEMVGSPLTGALHVAQGITQSATGHPIQGALTQGKGYLEAAQIPSLFGGPELKEGIEAIPSAKHAGRVLNEIEHAAGGVPVSLKNAGPALARAQELMDAGHGNVPALKKLIARYTDPNKADMTYKEARDFMTAISKLSAKEKIGLTGQMKAQVAAVAKEFQNDIAEAAGQVGESARYYASIKEFARAKRLQAVANAMQKTITRYGFKAAGAGAAGTLGYELAKGALKPANENMPGGSPDLSALPAPVQKALEGAKITQGAPSSTYGGKQDIATVEEGDPKNITVRDPSKMSPQIVAHEGTHLWQSNLSPEAKSGMAQDNPQKPYLTPQDMYSLPAMRQKGVTMGHLSSEQQASVVQAYVQYPGMRKMLQPWIDDMSTMGKSNIMPTGPEDKSINTTPRAPEAPDWAYQPVSR